MPDNRGRAVQVLGAGLSGMQAALAAGQVTSTGLAAECLRRIAAFDRAGPVLNAVPVLNPALWEEARAADLRRAAGQTLSPLDGIPFTAKDSFSVKGLTVAAGSPAFAGLIAGADAFAIERLRAAGAVLIGLTNMPPMANGGMQRGLYGRAESPWNGAYLTSAYASGSSNGSGTATAAGFGAFGLGEETWSSGRAPAALNGLCAYTPSRGMISVRGNWPLVPTMDVVVPHTRSMQDMLALLAVLVAEDAESRGDFWRRQPWVALPSPTVLAKALPGVPARASLAGKRLGVPRMFLNADPLAGTGTGRGIGGPTGQAIRTRASVLDLFAGARAALQAAGATVIETDFPVVSNYESDRPGAPSIATAGRVSAEYLRSEIRDLSAWAWDDFLIANGDPRLNRLAQVDGARIFPRPKGALPDRYTGFDDDIADYPAALRRAPIDDFRSIPHLEAGLRGLEATRQRDLEDWMDAQGLDAVIFPALADVAPADADINPASAEIAWANGTWVANGNLAIRHLGIPTVTVPMGVMADTGMPMGLTFAGRGWHDAALLALALAFEAAMPAHPLPPRTPALDPLPRLPLPPAGAPDLALSVQARAMGDRVHLTITADAPLARLIVAGQDVPPDLPAEVTLPANRSPVSDHLPPWGPLVIALARDGRAAHAEVTLPA